MWSINNEGNKNEEYTKEYHFIHFGVTVAQRELSSYLHNEETKLKILCSFLLTFSEKSNCFLNRGIPISGNSKEEHYIITIYFQGQKLALLLEMY